MKNIFQPEDLFSFFEKGNKVFFKVHTVIGGAVCCHPMTLSENSTQIDTTSSRTFSAKDLSKLERTKQLRKETEKNLLEKLKKRLTEKQTKAPSSLLMAELVSLSFFSAIDAALYRPVKRW